ncbi:MAG: hypothetical protein ACE5IJ_01390 [Thermoplasmata archaeon]
MALPVEAIAIAVVGIIAMQGMWLAFLTYMMYKRKRTQEAKLRRWIDKPTIVDEIFLLHKSGLLIKHYTRRLKPDLDTDILSAMLIAVQEFVKDSFRGEKGSLDELKFGELRIIIARGKHTILASVVTGEHPEDIVPQLKMALEDIEKKHGMVLAKWSGTEGEVYGVDSVMKDLIKGEYRLKAFAAGEI